MVDIAQAFAEYSASQYLDNLLEIMTQADVTKHYSLVVNFATLFEEKIELGTAIVTEPEVTLPLFDAGLVAAQKIVLESVDDRAGHSVKINVHARIIGLPTVAAASHKTTFPKNDELGNFLKVVGIVGKVTLPKLLKYEQEYRCSKCKRSQVVTANYNLNNALLPPQVCGESCHSTSFTAVKTCTRVFKDYQEIKVHEDVGKLQMGKIPSSIWITVEHDLVDTCQPGDHVTVWGTVMRRWIGLTVGKREEVELVVKANNIQVTNYQKTARLVTNEFETRCSTFWKKYENRPLEGRDVILASFCPEVYGLYLVKLAMCIVLCGGVRRLQEDGSFVRSESHLLLVGDPGTGKSQMLRFAAKTSTRSVLTTGIGCSSAGLTVTAVREGSDWQLEAGALVLADGGVCCIDELSSIREQDRTSIHEAMEQQTISVAKAGMVTKLNTRCSILAATNPKAGYDPSESLSNNVTLASPLLSRFDLVLVLEDSRSRDWDRVLSDFILEFSEISFESSDEIWSIDTLQSYFAFAKTFHPVMTQEAQIVLSRYYQTQRDADDRNAARTTVRMLESLVRLSQGHARLMLRNEVTILDAVVAVTLIECSMASSALVAATNALYASFPTDPDKQYRHQAELILERLGLTNLMERESERLNQVDDRLANESAGKTDGLIFEDRPDQANLLSQRLTDILTGIKKKKDRDVCQSANLAGKRRRESETRKKQKFRKIDDDELEAIEECDEPESGPKPEINEESERIGKDERLNKVELLKLEPGQRKPLLSTTAAKLLMFKKASFSKGSGCEEATNESRPDDSMGLKGTPVYSSTPLKSVSSQHCAPLTLPSSIGCESTTENPSTSVSNPAIGSKSSECPVINGTETVQPTQGNSKAYDSNKLKNLAKLGKKLSQSQKCSQASSQFSLHEMSWDDLDAEL